MYTIVYIIKCIVMYTTYNIQHAAIGVLCLDTRPRRATVHPKHAILRSIECILLYTYMCTACNV